MSCSLSLRRLSRAFFGFTAALVIVAASPGARSEVWGYVDETGQPHVSDHQLDDRYQLFFRGEASTEAPGTPVKVSAELESKPAPSTESAPVIANPDALRRFERLIERHAAREAVDPALVKAVVAVESGFSPRAVSPKGALGLMQVMPQTAARYGVTGDKRKTAEEKLFDPAVNVGVGTRYLRDLLARFADDIALALAAYNAGENAVERHNNRVPPYRETMEYVKRVQALYAAFRPPSAPAASQATAKESAPTLLGRRRVKGTFFALPVAGESAAPPML